MSQSFPPSPGGLAPNPSGYPPHPGGYQPTYASHPAYLGMPSPTPQHSRMNPWVAALLGALTGTLLTGAAGVLLWFVMGYPMPWQGVDDWAEDWRGTVAVASDGSVAGPALADAVLEVGGGGYYEEVSCPATPRAAADVMTLCDVDDGYDQYRVVVLFLDSDGNFESAEMLGQ